MSKAYLAGRAAIGNGDYRQAERDLEATLAEEPEHAHAMAWLVYARCRKRRGFRSMRLLHQAQKLAPTDPEVLEAIGRVHLWYARWSAAAASFKQALNMNPRSSSYHALLALAYLGARRKNECQAALKEALRLSPRNTLALEVKQKVEKHYFDPKTAMASAKTQLHENPESYSAHINAGEACLANGQVDQAYWHYREALRISPNSTEAQDAILTALCHRFPLYNWVHRISVRIRKYRFPGMFALFYISAQILSHVFQSAAVPPWVRSAAVGVVIGVGVLIAAVVLPMPIMAFAIRFHRIGRYAMTRLDRVETAFSAVVLITALLSGIVALVTNAAPAQTIFGTSLFIFVFLAFSAASLRRSEIRGLLLGIYMTIWLSVLGAVAYAAATTPKP